MVNPVAQNEDAGCAAQHQIQLDVSVPIQEIIDGGVILQVFFGIAYQVFLILTHVGWFLAVYPFQSAVFSPSQSKVYAPARMQGRKQALQGAAMKQVS